MLDGSKLVFGGSKLVFGGSKLLLEENSPVLELEGRKPALLGIMVELVGLRPALLESRLELVLTRLTGSVAPGVKGEGFSGEVVCLFVLLSGEYSGECGSVFTAPLHRSA